MADGRNDTMAQAVFLAQLEAAKGKCQCPTCKILRRASDLMTAQFLKPQPTPQSEVNELAGVLGTNQGDNSEMEV